jgi:hypothetical protein
MASQNNEEGLLTLVAPSCGFLTFSGHNYDFQLLVYEPRRRQLKNRIRMCEIVMVRSNMDYYFQIYLMTGKILHFKADTIDRQAHWMAMLKVGLGKGEWLRLYFFTTPPTFWVLILSLHGCQNCTSDSEYNLAIPQLALPPSLLPANPSLF